MTALSGKTAKDLDQMTREQLKQACGESEGSRIYSLFTVQKGSWKVLIGILLAKINLPSDAVCRELYYLLEMSDIRQKNNFFVCFFSFRLYRKDLN